MTLANDRFDLRSAFRHLFVPMVLLLATSCSAADSTAAPTPLPTGPILQTVRFGATPDTLLLSTCGSGPGRVCTVTLVDVARRRNVEYAAQSGSWIESASFAGDAVMAVVMQLTADAHGNRRSAIVTFAPDGGGAMTVRHHEPALIASPVNVGGRLLFWKQDCRSLSDRYCQYDLFAAAGINGATRIGQSYRFAEVGRIVPHEKGLVVNADYPAEGVTSETFPDYKGSNSAWRFASDRPFGLAKLTDQVDVIEAMPLTGGDLLFYADEGHGKSVGLFRQTASGLKRLADLPPATTSKQAFFVIGVDASHDGKWVAMIIADPHDSTTLFILDVDRRVWRTVDPAEYRPQRRINLKETSNAR